MELTTKRLRVRDFRASDADALHALLSDPAVMRYLEPPYNKKQTEDFIETAGLCAPPLVYAVERRETGALAGYVIFHRFEEDSFELGWALLPALWGRGFAGELTEALLAEATARGAAAAVIECDPAQAATRRIAEKYGFSLDRRDDGDGLLIYRKML